MSRGFASTCPPLTQTGVIDDSLAVVLCRAHCVLFPGAIESLVIPIAHGDIVLEKGTYARPDSPETDIGRTTPLVNRIRGCLGLLAG